MLVRPVLGIGVRVHLTELTILENAFYYRRKKLLTK